MSQANSSDAEWLIWIEIQKEASRSLVTGNLLKAISVVTKYVESKPPLDLKRQAFGFLGSLQQEAGDLEKAKASFLIALELSEVFDFERATLEESIAAISLRLGDASEAGTWYVRAIETAHRDPRAFNAINLLRLLEVRAPSELSQLEKELMDNVILDAWVDYDIVGQPDLSDIRSCADSLVKAQRESRRSGS